MIENILLLLFIVTGCFMIALKIAFWDHNVNRPKAPNLSEILFMKGTFYYYEANPKTQALVLVHEESYDDAMKALAEGE